MILCLGLAFAAPAQAQTYDVVGLVQDEQKGLPIADVEISLQSGKVLGHSKSNGRFEITVNSHNATLIFSRHTYKTMELDLSELTELIDIEVGMQSDVLELAEKDTITHLGPSRELETGKSMEELEALQGMKIDLNDHLRQLPGVSGMNEFTNDISVWGSRTNDVTHYLGQSRIASLRHLDIGFPGNQSVLNPRLLKSITVSDNLAKGPLNQGNASALVYDLRDGDPNYITGDVVIGLINRELNMTGYWGGRTFLLSGRYLEPSFLSNMGEKFFTVPKDARLQVQGDTTHRVKDLANPFSFNTMDGYLGTVYRDSTGAYARHSLITLSDDYSIDQDVSNDPTKSDAQTIVKGTQDAIMYNYEAMSPYATGDLQYSLGYLHRNRQEVFHDTLPHTNDVDHSPPWYQSSGGSLVDPLIGDASVGDEQYNAAFQWNANEKLLGATYAYGLDMEYLDQSRQFQELANTLKTIHVPQDYLMVNGLFRMRWGFDGKRALDAAAGGAFVYSGALDGSNTGFNAPAPLVSLRYSFPVPGSITGYVESALRQNTEMAPMGVNGLEALTTSSAEAKVGGEAAWTEQIKVTASLYSRFYKDPLLPVPEIYWNYKEIHTSDFAYANGGNVTVTWLPSHHVGMNMNASIVQGDYHLSDNDAYLPWEANRSLDLVSNIRLLPRNDSLLSFILTYGVNNGIPLYEYTGLTAGNDQHSTLQRAVRQSAQFPTVSRQRMDLRINLDLKSHWRPLDGLRFFFEGDNLFADMNNGSLSWLGGDNQRRRGWTRANPNGDLDPIVTRGLGLFLMFGIEGKLLI